MLSRYHRGCHVLLLHYLARSPMPCCSSIRFLWGYCPFSLPTRRGASRNPFPERSQTVVLTACSIRTPVLGGGRPEHLQNSVCVCSTRGRTGCQYHWTSIVGNICRNRLLAPLQCAQNDAFSQVSQHAVSFFKSRFHMSRFLTHALA